MVNGERSARMQFNLNHKQRILTKIDKLRKKHTEFFNSQKWLQMQMIREKIVKLWKIYHEIEN